MIGHGMVTLTKSLPCFFDLNTFWCGAHYQHVTRVFCSTSAFSL